MPSPGMRVEVPSIPAVPSPHGLLGGCVDIITTTELHELNGTDMRATTCAQANGWQDCPDVVNGWPNPAAKLFDGFDTCTFEPITAYAGVICSAPGFTFAEAQAQALQVLALGEQRVLEDFFLRRFLTDGTHTQDLSAPGPSILHIANGLGLLEAWLAQEYGGVGVVHAPVGVAALMSKHRLVSWPTDEQCPETLAGNSVVFGAGYGANLGPAVFPAPPVPAGPEEVWLYITPAMRIRRDTPHNVVSNEGNGVNIRNNDRRALAETTFVPEVACCKAAAVRVSLSACC